jgi:hypothetical protein
VRRYIVFYQDLRGDYHCDGVRAQTRLTANAIIRAREDVRHVFGIKLPKGLETVQRHLLQRLRNEPEEPG